MADLGFKQISVEPVVGEDTTDYAIREEDIPAVCEEYERLAAELYERHKKAARTILTSSILILTLQAALVL